MRCDNCGWSNPDHLTKCQKCNQDLVAPVSAAPAPVAASNAINQTIIEPSRQGAAQQSSSAASCLRCGYPLSAESQFCPNCGTQAQQAAPAPAAHAKTVMVLPEEFLEPAQDTHKVETLKATVREIPAELMNNARFSQTVRVLPEEMLVDAEPEIPVAPAQPAEPSFKLTPMDNFDGATSKAVEQTGASVSVKRETLVAEGTYVPEGLDVEFTCADGQWSVLDKSCSKAVFVSASHPVSLQPGDVIVIGNRRFIFE